MTGAPERIAPEAFAELWRRLQARGDPGPMYGVVCSAYSAADRHYHTLDHIAHVLTLFDGVRHRLPEPEAADAALWFHDVVYDTHATDSEAQSAARASATLEAAGVRSELVSRVGELILATTHAAVPQHPDARYVVDIDLSILGAAEADFDRYERQIREEYAWVSEPTFRERRASILRAFLARPTIYLTPEFLPLENHARANLARSLSRL